MKFRDLIEFVLAFPFVCLGVASCLAYRGFMAGWRYYCDTLPGADDDR